MQDLSAYVAGVAKAAGRLRNLVPAETRTALFVDGDSGLPPGVLDGHIEDCTGSPLLERVSLGTLAGSRVLILSGLRRIQDGVTASDVAFPVRVIGALGLERIILSGTARAVSPAFSSSDWMVVSDHLNLLGENPLSGPNHADWGPRFPDMTQPYDPAFRVLVSNTDVDVREGIYAGVRNAASLPDSKCLDLRELGANAVGAEWVPEVLAARHMDIRVLALMRITGSCGGATGSGILDPASLRTLLMTVV